MRPAQLALAGAEQRLVDRLEYLVKQIAAGDETLWPEYAQLAASLATIVPLTSPGAGDAR